MTDDEKDACEAGAKALRQLAIIAITVGTPTRNDDLDVIFKAAETLERLGGRPMRTPEIHKRKGA